MKKNYNNPEINIKYFECEYIRATEEAPMPRRVNTVSGNYEQAQSWLQQLLEKNGDEAIGIIAF